MVSRVSQPLGGSDCQCEPDQEPGNYRAEHGIDGGYRDFVPVSRARRMKKNASRTCMVSIVLIGGVSLAATILSFAGHTPLYRAIHAGGGFDEASLYLLIVGAFILVRILSDLLSDDPRICYGKAEVMIISVIMNAMNIVGNAILINGWFGMPQLGAVGAAISDGYQ